MCDRVAEIDYAADLATRCDEDQDEEEDDDKDNAEVLSEIVSRVSMQNEDPLSNAEIREFANRLDDKSPRPQRRWRRLNPAV
jgi:hypothetical protein